jgi:hypothetical protein
LLELVESLGITVRTAQTGSAQAAALVRLKGREVLFMEASAALADRIDAVAAALAGRAELADRFLLPEVRAAIERAAPEA